jgi:signal transduction histidine kinase
VPHAGLEQIDELIADARYAGLDIVLERAQSIAAPPTAVDSAAYRIVQESLTNVLRHVGPTRVRIGIDFGVDLLELQVTNEEGCSRTGASPSPTPGRGILGMRERCQLLGGDLEAGRTPDGGFAVVARLPLAPSEGTAQ